MKSASVFTTLAGDFVVNNWELGWPRWPKFPQVFEKIRTLSIIKFLDDDIMNLWIDDFRCSTWLSSDTIYMFLERQTLQTLVVHHVPSVRGEPSCLQITGQKSTMKHWWWWNAMWNAMWNGEQISEQLLKLSLRHADLFCSQAFWKQIHALLKQLQIALSSVLQKKILGTESGPGVNWLPPNGAKARLRLLVIEFRHRISPSNLVNFGMLDTPQLPQRSLKHRRQLQGSQMRVSQVCWVAPPAFLNAELNEQPAGFR